MQPAARFSSILIAAALLLGTAAFAHADGGDPTSPQIFIETPADGGVYFQGQQAQAGYACVPGSTGIPAVSCVGDVPLGAFFDTSSAGAHTFTVRATDPFGNVTSLSHTYTVVDVIAPTITLSTPQDGAVYEFGSQATVQYSCDDPGGSGVVYCNGTFPNTAPLPTNQLGSFTFDVLAFDAAGNSSTVHAKYQVVDTIPPTINVRTPRPPDGDNLPTYALGDRVLADYDCSDGTGSGIAFCGGPVSSGSPIDTTTAGTHRFTVQANDAAHNSTSVSRFYQVVYLFDGFASPLVAYPTLASLTAGNQVPAKFSLHGDHGPGVVTSASSQQITCDTLAVLGDASSARGTTTYNSGPDRYTFQWQTDRTWKGTCRRLSLTLDDGTTHRANVQFTK